MVIGALDGNVKDVRKTGPTTPKLLDISQKGLLGVAIGSKIEI
jgi:hypothetical protein